MQEQILCELLQQIKNIVGSDYISIQDKAKKISKPFEKFAWVLNNWATRIDNIKGLVKKAIDQRYSSDDTKNPFYEMCDKISRKIVKDIAKAKVEDLFKEDIVKIVKEEKFNPWSIKNILKSRVSKFPSKWWMVNHEDIPF